MLVLKKVAPKQSGTWIFSGRGFQYDPEKTSIFVRQGGGIEAKAKHVRSGYLLLGRNKAILVEADDYAKESFRSIHLNPIRAGAAKTLRGLYHYLSIIWATAPRGLSPRVRASQSALRHPSSN